MRSLIFLPGYVTYGMFFFLLYGLWKFSFGWFVFTFFICSAVVFLFRRSRIPFRETIKNDGEIYLSPVYGKIKSIRQNIEIPDSNQIGHEIRISISFWDPKGLYLPTQGEATYLKATKGRKISRDAESEAFYGSLEEVAHTHLTLTSRKINSLLRFVDSPYGIRPTIWLKSGDKGRGAACFGYFPFGGTLFIYLPQNSDILVFESERTIPAQTVIGSLKDLI